MNLWKWVGPSFALSWAPIFVPSLDWDMLYWPGAMAKDCIILEGMAFYGYHGVASAERTLGQRLLVDVEAFLNLAAAGASDNLKDTVSYDDLYQVVKNVLEGEPRNLLETLASDIAQRILREFPVSKVSVKVWKVNPPIQGAQLSGAGVRITRSRRSS